MLRLPWHAIRHRVWEDCDSPTEPTTIAMWRYKQTDIDFVYKYFNKIQFMLMHIYSFSIDRFK